MEFKIDHESIPVNLDWLRNNCRCENCFNSVTNENKLTDTLVDIYLKHYSIKGEDLHIVWSDDHISKYNIKWIEQQQRPEIRPEVVTWYGTEIENQIAFVESAQNELSEDKVAKLLKSILKFGVAVVKNVVPSMEATEKVCQQIGPIMNTFYGGMWEIKQETFDVYKDTAYTNLALGVHTDNTYAIDPAGVQVFHCLEPAQSGGETVLVDGFKAAEVLRKRNEKHYQWLETIPVEWHYNSKEYHHIYNAPMICTSKDTKQLEQIRYNTYHRSARVPFASTSALSDYYESLKAFTDILHEPKMEWNVALKPGNVIFINNWRLLHGRKQFTGRRKLIGCYISMNTLLSKARYFTLIR